MSLCTLKTPTATLYFAMTSTTRVASTIVQLAHFGSEEPSSARAVASSADAMTTAAAVTRGEPTVSIETRPAMSPRMVSRFIGLRCSRAVSPRYGYAEAANIVSTSNHCLKASTRTSHQFNLHFAADQGGGAL